MADVLRHWKQISQPVFSFSPPSRCDRKKSNSEALIGLTSEGHVFRFGCPIHDKPYRKKLVLIHAPLSKPGIFIGWHLWARHSWTKLYKVLDHQTFLTSEFQVQIIREVPIQRCERQVFHLPLAAAREQALKRSQPLDLSSIIEEIATSRSNQTARNS